MKKNTIENEMKKTTNESIEKNPNSEKAALKTRSSCRCCVPLLPWEAVLRWLDYGDDEARDSVHSFHAAIPSAVCEPAYLLTDRAVTSRAYALRLNYEVMMPLLSNGSILIIEPTRKPVLGDRVVVQIGDDPVACLKRWRITQAGEVMLQSVNPVLMPVPDKPLTDQVRVLGVVVQSIITRYPPI